MLFLISVISAPTPFFSRLFPRDSDSIDSGKNSRLAGDSRTIRHAAGPHQRWISAVFLAGMRPMHIFPGRGLLYL